MNESEKSNNVSIYIQHNTHIIHKSIYREYLLLIIVES